MIVRVGGQIIICTPETVLPGGVTPQELFDRVLEKRFNSSKNKTPGQTSINRRLYDRHYGQLHSQE
jgi:hypothetical protein